MRGICGRQNGKLFLPTLRHDPYLLPELLDDVVYFLHNSGDTLEGCSLVSNSWIPRTRKHFFAKIWLHCAEDLKSWNAVFADPSTLPRVTPKPRSLTPPTLSQLQE